MRAVLLSMTDLQILGVIEFRFGTDAERARPQGHNDVAVQGLQDVRHEPSAVGVKPTHGEFFGSLGHVRGAQWPQTPIRLFPDESLAYATAFLSHMEPLA